jgi:BMFP domain-containing protein YqiC
MNINKKIRIQLEILKELDLIIYSPDFQNSSFENQRKILIKKKEKLDKLKFLYNLEEALLFEKDKEISQRNRKLA